MKPGKIVITDKVYFKPNGIEAPVNPGREGTFSEDINFIKNVEEYIASRKLVEVENVKEFFGEWVLTGKEVLVKDLTALRIKNNQPCKADINNDKATIIELTK